MSSGSFATVSSEKNTVHYAMPHRPTVSVSANNSINSDHSHNSRVPGIQYPSVSVPQQYPSPSSPSSTHSLPRPVPYSVSQLQYDNMKHRCRMLDTENQRLMRSQNDVVLDANRRVEMHLNEIRMLKEENKKLNTNNKELRDLCCFLDDDRQKVRRLAKEWQKFGRYTSNVMRQELHSYQQRMAELERRGNDTTRENEELRQLCLYLDEQRQALITRQEEESEDLGCGSSERSSDSGQYKSASDPAGYNTQKENALRLISEQMQTSLTSFGDQSTDQTRGTEKMLNYIQSLESRIKHLELAQAQGEDSFWTSASNLASDSDEKTVIERWEEGEVVMREKKNMQISTTSTMTSSGTTYGSSETDQESAVYVMGDEIDAIGNLEVRTLNKIEEERDNEHGERPDDEGVLPPPCAPLSASLLSVGRLSMGSEADFRSSDIFEGNMRSSSAASSPAVVKSPLPAPRATSVEKSSCISDAVKVLREHERAQKSERDEMSRGEAAIVQHLCQVAWDSIDRNSITRPADISAV